MIHNLFTHGLVPKYMKKKFLVLLFYSSHLIFKSYIILTNIFGVLVKETGKKKLYWKHYFLHFKDVDHTNSNIIKTLLLTL